MWRKNSWDLAIIFLLILSIAPYTVFAQDENIKFRYPEKVEFEEAFEVNLTLNNFSIDAYDIKIDISDENDERISRIENNERWQSTFNYIDKAINTSVKNSSYFLMKISKKYNGTANIDVRVRNSDSIETFSGYEIGVYEEKDENETNDKPKKIEINTASEEELNEITSITEKRAKEITILRLENPFYSIEDLERVYGVGSSRVSDIKNEGIAYINESILPELKENVDCDNGDDEDDDEEEKAQEININSANEEKLQEIIGIGPTYAERIIEYREENLFCEMSELTEIKGIAEGRLENIKNEGIAYIDPGDNCSKNIDKSSIDKSSIDKNNESEDIINQGKIIEKERYEDDEDIIWLNEREGKDIKSSEGKIIYRSRIQFIREYGIYGLAFFYAILTIIILKKIS